MARVPSSTSTADPIVRAIERWSHDDDDDGDTWIAWLDCGHRRHVRHRPPLSAYPWVVSETGRAARIGTSIECGRCSQRIWPEGFELHRTSRVFTHDDVPDALRSDHRTRAGVWGKLRVLEGALQLDFQSALGVSDELSPGVDGVIPPEVPHRVVLDGPVRFVVEFHRRQRSTETSTTAG